MVIISIINRKGGVGKTTTAVNLAVGLNRFHDKKVLLVDADPQANASIHLGIRVKEAKDSIAGVFLTGRGIEEVVRTVEGIDIVPSHLELDLVEEKYRDKSDEDSIGLLTLTLMDKNYDVAIIDCPPSLGFLSKNALVVSDSVIIPITGEYLPVEGLASMIKNIVDIRDYNPNLTILGILITQMQKTVMYGTMSEHIKRKLGGRFRVFETLIRRNTLLAEASATGKSIYEYNKSCRGYQDYRDFTFEINNLLKEVKQ